MLSSLIKTTRYTGALEVVAGARVHQAVSVVKAEAVVVQVQVRLLRIPQMPTIRVAG